MTEPTPPTDPEFDPAPAKRRKAQNLKSAAVLATFGWVGWLIWRESPGAKDDPRRPLDGDLRFAGAVLITLALLVAFLFPQSAAAGTETALLRYSTAAVLLVAGVLFRAGRTAASAVGAGVLLLAAVVIHAWWLAAVVALTAVTAAAAFCMRPVWRRFFPADPERDETTSDVVESIATAFVLALVVREFAFEAFKIPTGSMEPTILGEGMNRRSGDRLLASKAPLLFDAPKRWQIIVFKYPLFHPTNYIKRCIGLPGEHVENRNGDIYVNGKVVAKPEEVQETLWFPLFPDASGHWPDGGLGSKFTPESAGTWKFDETGASGSSAAGKTEWITCQSSEYSTSYPDVRLSFDVDPAQLGEGGAVLARIDGAGRSVELEAKQGGMWISGPGVEKTKLAVDGLGATPSRLGFAVADRVARVYRDGRLVARVETADKPNINSIGDHSAIGVSGGAVRVSKIKVEHDLQYVNTGALNDWHVPKDCFLMLGDNTSSSKDSRLWQGRVFRFKPDKDGKVRDDVIADYGDVRVDDVSQRRAVEDRGDAFEVLDSYGVQRRILKADLVGGTYTTENEPFVRREDLVGRAFLTFFPFPPLGEWRPRILP